MDDEQQKRKNSIESINGDNESLSVKKQKLSVNTDEEYFQSGDICVSSDDENDCVSSDDENDEESNAVAQPEEVVSSSKYSNEGERIDQPLPTDILLGRGKPFQNHNGNKRMLTFINKHKEAYCTEKRENRRAYACRVLDEIVDTGGRFLKQAEGENYWVVIAREVALEKVSHALRSKDKKQSAMKRTENGIASGLSAWAGGGSRLGLSGAAVLPPGGIVQSLLYPHPTLGLIAVPAVPVMLGPPEMATTNDLMRQGGGLLDRLREASVARNSLQENPRNALIARQLAEERMIKERARMLMNSLQHQGMTDKEATYLSRLGLR